MDDKNSFDYIFKAYVVNTAAYDAGDREESGAWLYFPPHAEDIIDLFEKIGLPMGATPDMYFMDDYISNIEGLKPLLPMYGDIEELSALAQGLYDLSHEEREVLDAVQSSSMRLTTLEQYREFPYNQDYFILEPQTMDDAALGWKWFEHQGITQFPKGCENAIDPVPFGRYVREQEQGVFTDKGYLVKSGDEWQKKKITFVWKNEDQEKKPSIRERLDQGKKHGASNDIENTKPTKHGPEL